MTAPNVLQQAGVTPLTPSTQPVATAPTAVLPETPATPARPAAPKRTVSPFYFRYLNDQAAAITARGGSDADVNQFLDMEQRKPFSGTPTATPTLQDLLGPDASPTMLRGVSMAVLQGATFGFGDEAVGTLLGHLTGVGARAGIEEYRREYAEWSDQHSKTALAAEIAGGFVPAILSGGASVEAALTKRGIGATAATAAGYGAAYGAGNAEGAAVSDPDATLGDEVTARLWGAVTGAAAGGMLGAAAHGLGHFVAAPLVAKAAATPVGKPVAAAVENAMSRLAGRDVVALTPEARARQRLASTLLSEGVTFEELKGSLADMHRAGVPATVVDVAGDATQALAADVLKTRSPATAATIAALKERQGGQAQRLTSGLLDVAMQRNRFGIANATATAEELQTRALLNSKPLYNTAHEQVVQLTPKLQELLAQPEIQAGYNAGADMARLEDLGGRGHGLPVAPLGKAKTPQSRGEFLTKLADLPLKDRAAAFAAWEKGGGSATELPVRGIDYLQRGLQEIINKGRNAEGWSAQRIRALQGLRDEVVAETERQVPAFAQARAAYRGPTASNDAIDLGKDMFNMAPAELQRAMRNVHPADRDYARLGYVQKVYDATLRDNTGDVAQTFFGGNMIGKPSYRMEQIKALFPEAPAAAEAFARQLAGETLVSHATGNVVRGVAPTSLEQIEQRAVGTLPPARVNAQSLAVSVARQGLQRMRASMSRDEADELTHTFSKGLTRRGAADTGPIPAELQVYLDNLHHSFGGIIPKASAKQAAARAAGQAGASFLGR
jgi:hypothetical protein